MKGPPCSIKGPCFTSNDNIHRVRHDVYYINFHKYVLYFCTLLYVVIIKCCYAEII